MHADSAVILVANRLKPSNSIGKGTGRTGCGPHLIANQRPPVLQGSAAYSHMMLPVLSLKLLYPGPYSCSCKIKSDNSAGHQFNLRICGALKIQPVKTRCRNEVDPAIKLLRIRKSTSMCSYTSSYSISSLKASYCTYVDCGNTALS